MTRQQASCIACVPVQPMRTLVIAMLAVLLLAGCSSSSDGGGATPTSSTGAGDVRGVCVDESIRPYADANPDGTCPPYAKRESIPVTFSGNLGTIVHGCLFPPGQPPVCPTQVVNAGSGDLFVEKPGANFTGLDMNITWTSQTPATATLAVGFMVMAGCDGCEDTFFDEVEGTSPIRIQVKDQKIPLNETTKVHVYVYNPTGLQVLPAGAGYVFVSVDQDYAIEGKISIETLVTPTAKPAPPESGSS